MDHLLVLAIHVRKLVREPAACGLAARSGIVVFLPHTYHGLAHAGCLSTQVEGLQ